MDEKTVDELLAAVYRSCCPDAKNVASMRSTNSSLGPIDSSFQTNIQDLDLSLRGGLPRGRWPDAFHGIELQRLCYPERARTHTQSNISETVASARTHTQSNISETVASARTHTQSNIPETVSMKAVTALARSRVQARTRVHIPQHKCYSHDGITVSPKLLGLLESGKHNSVYRFQFT